MATITNTICSNNKEIDIQSLGGALNIGNSAVATNITIGNTTSTSSITLNVGSGSITIPSFTTTGALVSNASGVITDANANTTGFVLTSNGAGSAPSFQAASGGGIGTLAGNSGTASGSTVTISGGSTGLTTSGASSTITLSGTLAIANGGTGVTTPTTTPTASKFVGWDANSNISANNFLSGFTTSSTSTVTLTVSSSQIQVFTSSSATTVTLPVASTLVLGQQFIMMNRGTGTVTVQTSGANTLISLVGQTVVTYFVCVLTSGTTAASWQVSSNMVTDLNYNVTLGTGAAQILNFATQNGNTILGSYAGSSLVTGVDNVYVGYNAGINTVTSTSNINIGYNASSPATSSHQLLIGNGTGTGAGQLNSAQICGINGITSASDSNLVMINSTDQLTTASSTQVIYPTINVTSGSVTLIPGYMYTMNNGTLVTATLPTTVSVGTKISVYGNGAGGWKIAQSSGQQIHSTATSTTSGATGSLSSGGQYDCVELICTVANTTWSINSFVGTLSFV